MLSQNSLVTWKSNWSILKKIGNGYNFKNLKIIRKVLKLTSGFSEKGGFLYGYLLLLVQFAS